MKAAIVVAMLVAWTTPEVAERGVASIYGNDDGHAGTCVAEQKPTGGCYRMDPRALTAAHRTLPFGTIVEVTNLFNKRVAYLRINDRGPYKRGRILDVTPTGAEVLGFERDGLAPVQVVVIQP